MSRYPAELDNDSDLPPITDNITEIGAEAINSLRASIFALERALGINPQGSQLSLSERLSRSLNTDGTFKAAALSSAGLISLPITDSQIGSSAAIKESKLDLDISTLSLQNQISSNDIDILELQDSVAVVINHIAQHIVGNYGRHDGYQIDIQGLTGQPGLLTVEDGLNFVYDTFLRHRKTNVSGEHLASAISYTPVPNGFITATNVQDAIEQRDAQIIETFRLHRDNAHSNGISSDGYLYLNGQAATNDASLRLTRYISSVGSNLVKVGLINSAVMVGDSFEPADISSTSDAIIITAKNGTSSRSITVSGLNSSSADYPSAASPRFKLKGIVNHLNSNFGNAANNFPVTAFESNGKLVLQHNIASDDCTILVSAPANSALGALGLSALADIEVSRVNNYVAVIDGQEYDEVNIVDSGSIIHPGGSTVTFASAVGSSEKYKLLHVYNHTSSTANGTYKITSVGVSSVNLAATVTAGSFDYIIYEDVFDLPSATNPVTFDFFIDSNLNLIAEKRIEAAPGPTGIKIVAASAGLTGTTASLQFSTGQLQLTVDGVQGAAVIFDTQYVGYVDVYAPDGIEFITVFIFNAGASIGTSTLTLFDSAAQDNRLLLGTSHFDLGSTIENPIDYRNVGLVGLTSIGSEFKNKILERDLANLHISGCIRGLEIETTSFPSSSITISGGIGYINGKYIERKRVTINAGNRISAAATYNLLLSTSGTYEIFDNAIAGYGIDDIIANDNYIVIAQLVGSAGSISSVTDARIFINDLELKLQLTVDERELGAGNFRTLEAAQLYAGNAPNDTKPEISIFSDITISKDLTINSNTRIKGIQSITVSGAAVTVTDNSTLEVFGNLISDSTITISNYSTLILNGNSNSLTAATSISLGANSTLIIDGYTAIKQINITGNGSRIISRNNIIPTVAFTADSAGISINSGVDGLVINDLNFVMSKTGQNAIISAQTLSNVAITGCGFSLDTPTITTTQATQVNRVGIKFVSGTITNILVTDCKFTNIAAGIMALDGTTASNLKIDSCTFESIGRALDVDSITTLIFTSNIITGMHQYGINFSDAAPGGNCSDIIIDNNIFKDNFAGGSSSPIAIRSVFSAKVINSLITNNIFKNLTTTSVITFTSENCQFKSNIIKDSTTSNAAVILSHSGGAYATASICAFNFIINNAGEALSATKTDIINNFIEVSAVTGAGVEIDGFSASIKFNDNLVVLPSDSNMDIYAEGTSMAFSNNIIYCDKINVYFADPADLNFCGNKIECSNAALGSSNGLDLTNTLDYSNIIINNNRISCNVGSAIYIGADSSFDLNSCLVSNNIVSGGTISGIEFATNTKTTASNIISNNIVRAAGNYGILTDAHNTFISGNTVAGTVALADISSATGAQKIYIAGNASYSSGAGAGVMASQDASPTAVYIGPNQNISTPIAYDVMTGWTSSFTGWSLTSDMLSTTSATQKFFYVPLENLPIGARLTSVDVHSYPNGVSSINIKLYLRSSTSLIATNIGPGAGVDNVSVATREVITISPSSTANQQIKPDSSYFIKIESNASGNQFAQVIANITY